MVEKLGLQFRKHLSGLRELVSQSVKPLEAHILKCFKSMNIPYENPIWGSKMPNAIRHAIQY